MNNNSDEEPVDQIRSPGERIHELGGMIVDVAARFSLPEIFKTLGKSAASTISHISTLIGGGSEVHKRDDEPK